MHAAKKKTELMSEINYHTDTSKSWQKLGLQSCVMQLGSGSMLAKNSNFYMFLLSCPSICEQLFIVLKLTPRTDIPI